MKKDNWILKAFLLTFFIALFFNAFSNIITNKFDNVLVLTLLAILFILIGIMFDMIGTALLIAEESTFHAKSSKRIQGAKEGVYLIKNGSSIASICNDVIGDICGIVSGSISAMIGILLASIFNISPVISTLLISSIVSSLTVGGKAIGKKVAIKNSDEIVFKVVKEQEYKYYNFKLEEKTNKEVLSTKTLYLVKEFGKYGYENKKGERVVDCKYDDANEQNDYGYCAVKKDGKWGVLKSDGSILLEPSINLDNNLIINFIADWYRINDSRTEIYTK